MKPQDAMVEETNLYGQRLRNNYAGNTRCSFNNAELTWPPL